MKVKLLVCLFFNVILNYNLVLSQNTLKNLLPVPEHVIAKQGKFVLDTSFVVKITGNFDKRLYPNVSRFLRRLDGRTATFLKQGFFNEKSDTTKASFIIDCKRNGIVKLNEDESYSLKITSKKIELIANTDIGAIRGLETLLQLLDIDKNGFFFPCTEIYDKPRFPWRGLLIDIGRHFMPMDVIKRNLDGMAAVKMNVLHLHISEDQGFRIECKTFPKLHLSGANEQYFTQEQIKEIIAYADERGIRVVPEFDMPGHSTSWMVGYPELASAPGPFLIETAFGVFNPTMNPIKPYTYQFLNAFIKEMAQLFPDEFFHIGGDENSGVQWDANKEIQNFKKANNFKSNHELQCYFNKELLKILTANNKKMMGWDEIFHPDLPNNIVIHSWRGIDYMIDAAKKGFQSVLSNGYYIDLSEPASKHYLIDPLPENIVLSAEQKKLILGGECTMWAELVTPENIDSRIWMRTAAIAERFWSPASVKDIQDMYRRIEILSHQIEELGLLHIKNREMMMRRILRSEDISALKVLANAIEPIKQYERHNRGIKYTTTTPLTRLVDIAVPDAPDAVKFIYAVDNYLKQPNDSLKRYIFAQLVIWNDNHKKLKSVFKNIPSLKSFEDVSKNLEIVGAVGLELLFALDKNEKVTSDWYNKKIEVIENIRKYKGEVEIPVVESINKILKALKI